MEMQYSQHLIKIDEYFFCVHNYQYIIIYSVIILGVGLSVRLQKEEKWKYGNTIFSVPN